MRNHLNRTTKQLLTAKKQLLTAKNQSYVHRYLDFTNMLRFDLGECDHHTHEFAHYPDPEASTVKKLVASIWSLPEENLTLSHGSDELIETIPRMILNPGDKVIVVEPTFFRFREASVRAGGQVIGVALEKKSLSFTKQVAKEVIRIAQQQSVKLIWLCSPNNPTGQVIQPRLIKSIVEQTNAFVVLDQALIDFLAPTQQRKSFSLLSHKNVLILRSFSKFLGMAGIRLGAGIGHPETIQVIEQFRLPFNLSSLLEKALPPLLEHLQSISMKSLRHSILKERMWFKKNVEKIPGIKVIKGSHTNLIVLQHSQKNLFEHLCQHKILVADFNNCPGIEGQHFIRITLGERKDNQILLEALKSTNLSQLSAELRYNRR